MAEKQSSVVLNFKTSGQIQYAKTIKDINSIMNTAAKEYRAQIKAMGDDATATDKLRAEKRKLETQLESGKERTQKLREEFLKMQENSKTTTAQLNNMYGKLKDSEAAESALESRLKQVNVELSEQGEASRKNQSELDKLQQESKELESQTEKLNSELRLQESTMGDAASESEKAAFAQEKYGKQSEMVEKQIANLERQLEIVKQEYGENSIEANKMETELNEAKLAFNNLNSEMSNTKGSADEAQASMGKMAELLQSQVYMEASQQLSQISEKLIELGKESVETAATFRANDAQFAQVFGNMEKTARETVAAMGDEMGILPRRLEPGYAAISSQLMSLGVDQQEAMQLAEQALTSSADAAAFYDQSLEDAQERVQSFIKGNMSAAEGIGIFATASGMATYAIQNGFVEATEEQQKFAEKMEITIEKAQKKVSEAQEKYGADSLQARDATQKLNEALEKQEQGLNLKSKWDELSEAQKQAVRVDYIKNMQEMAQVTGQAAREMDGYENVMGNMDSALDEIKASIGEELLTLLIDVAQQIIPLLSGFADWFTNLNPMVKQFALGFAGVITVVGTLLPMLATIGMVVSTGMLPVLGIVAAVAAAIAGIIVLVRNWGTISEWISEKWTSLVEFFSELFSNIGNSFSDFFSGIKEKWDEFWLGIFEKVEEIKTSLAEKFLSIKDGIVGKFIELKDGAIEIWNQIIEFLAPIGQKIFDYIMVPISLLQTALEAVWLLIRAGIDIVVAFFELAFTAMYDWFVQKGEALKAKAAEIFSVFKKNVIDPVNEMKNNIISKITELWQGIVNKFEQIKAAASEKWSSIKSAIVGKFTETKNSILGVASDIWSGILDKFEKMYSGVRDKFIKIKNAIIEPVVQAKDKIKETIDAIKDFFFNIKLPKFGLKTSSKTILGKEITYPSGIDVKWNAKGGIFTQPTIFGQSGGRLQGAGEAGPEAVLPLTEENLAAIGKGIPNNGAHVEQHIHIGQVDANNPSELDRLNRNVESANRQLIYELGGDPD